MHQLQPNQTSESSPDSRQDISVSLLAANVYTLLLSPLVALLAVPFLLLWGRERLGTGIIQSLDSIWLLPAFILGIIAHELLHGIGFVTFGRQSWQAVKFGFQWKSLTPYAHCRAPMPVAGYRWSVALPCLVFGLLPIAIATATGSGRLLIWGLVFCWVAGGDVIIFWLVRNAGPKSFIMDHPDRAGCYILPAADHQAGSQADSVESATNPEDK